MRGLPIVATTGGALGETIPDEAAMKVPPDDVQALGGSLAIALSDRKWRADLAAASPCRRGQTAPLGGNGQNRF